MRIHVKSARNGFRLRTRLIYTFTKYTGPTYGDVKDRAETRPADARSKGSSGSATLLLPDTEL